MRGAGAGGLRIDHAGAGARRLGAALVRLGPGVAVHVSHPPLRVRGAAPALAAADVAIALRQPSFSSLGASPTKLGEYLSCGLPVVVNDGVGDVGEIVERLDAGAVLSSMSGHEMDGVIARLDDILAIDPAALRERSRNIHDMPVALAKYGQVYDSIAASNSERVA